MTWFLVICMNSWGCASVPMLSLEACATAAADLTESRQVLVRCINTETGEVLEGTRRDWEARLPGND